MGLMTTEERPNASLEHIRPIEIKDAKWIWTDDDPENSEVWVYAKKRFHVQNCSRARLHISADLRYLVWINGNVLGFGPPKYHVSSPTLDTYPIERLLCPGENTITVLVQSFGADGYLNSIMPIRGALIASIELDDRLINTDSSWRAHREYGYRETGVRLNENQPYMEQFDARHSLGRPWMPDYDDSSWPAAIELSECCYEPWTSLEDRDIPIFNWQSRPAERMIEYGISQFAREMGELATAALSRDIGESLHSPDNTGNISIIPGLAGESDVLVCTTTKLSPLQGCYAVYDLGRVWTGYPVITLKGEPGTVVDLSYAEGLQNGRVNPAKQGLFYTDRIILGEGELTHRIMFPKCLRYLQVDVRGGRAEIRNVSMEVSTYPVLRKGLFHCSDPAIDQAWEVSAHTLQLCMEDSYMDTPWRERGAWLGDIVPESHANYYCFGDVHLVRRFLLLHTKGQREDGSLSGKYPGRYSSYISTWNLTHAIALLSYVQYTGDKELIEEVWPAIEGVCSWLDTYKREDGLYGDFPLVVTPTECVYTFIDWAPVHTGGANAALNAFAYLFLGACEKLSKWRGKADDADRFGQKAEGLRKQYQELLWDSVRNVFVNGVQDCGQTRRYGVHENAMACLLGLATTEQQQHVERFLEKNALASVFISDPAAYDGITTVGIALNEYPWDDDKPVPLGTPYFAYWLLQTLCESDSTAAALRFIAERWGEFSRRGGTTVWEEWSDGGSLSHAWSSAPVVIAGKYILGVTPSDAVNSWSVFPQHGDLSWASGRVPTPFGILGVSWQRTDSWNIDLVVPPGITVTFGLPDNEVTELVVDGNTVSEPLHITHCGHNRLSVKVIEGIHSIQGRNGAGLE